MFMDLRRKMEEMPVDLESRGKYEETRDKFPHGLCA